jgi:hypothetical protein
MECKKAAEDAAEASSAGNLSCRAAAAVAAGSKKT